MKPLTTQVNAVSAFLIQHLLAHPADPVIEYAQLGKATGISRKMYRPVLEKVGNLCHQHHLPDITAIVVPKDTRKPGKAFLAQTPGAWLEIVRVQRYNWQPVIAEKLLHLAMPGYEDDPVLTVLAPYYVLFLDTHESDILEGDFRAKPYNHKTMPHLIVGHDRNKITDIKKPFAWSDLGNGRSRCKVDDANEFAYLIGQPVPKYALTSRNPVRYFNC